MNKARSIILAALVGVLVSGPAWAAKHTVGLVCEWSSFGTDIETFLVNEKDKTVYWVNQNKMLDVKDFNEGRILMSGTRKRVWISEAKREKNTRWTLPSRF